MGEFVPPVRGDCLLRRFHDGLRMRIPLSVATPKGVTADEAAFWFEAACREFDEPFKPAMVRRK